MVNIQGPCTFYKVPGLPLCKQPAIYNFSYKSKIALMEIVSIKEGIQRTRCIYIQTKLNKMVFKVILLCDSRFEYFNKLYFSRRIRILSV